MYRLIFEKWEYIFLFRLLFSISIPFLKKFSKLLVILNEEEDLSEENNARFFLNGKESQPNLDININNNQPGFQNKNLELKEEEQKKEENKKTKMTTKEKSFAFGRKRAEDKESDFKGHGKCSEDNMMRKNKVYVMDFILKFLNYSLKNKKYKFYRIDKKIMECLKKDFNLKLLNRTIKDIFYNEITSRKYRGKIDEHINRFVINRIMEENNEEDTIRILNLRFKDIITLINSNQIINFEFFKVIEEKEKKNSKENSENIKEYIRTLKYLLFNYENWFKNKIGRRKSKKINFKVFI